MGIIAKKLHKKYIPIKISNNQDNNDIIASSVYIFLYIFIVIID